MTEWTIDTLKEHLEALAAEQAKAIDVALKAADEKAKTHNDILGAMKDQQATYVTKGMVLTALGAALTVLGLVIAYFANFGS